MWCHSTQALKSISWPLLETHVFFPSRVSCRSYFSSWGHADRLLRADGSWRMTVRVPVRKVTGGTLGNERTAQRSELTLMKAGSSSGRKQATFGPRRGRARGPSPPRPLIVHTSARLYTRAWSQSKQGESLRERIWAADWTTDDRDRPSTTPLTARVS